MPDVLLYYAHPGDRFSHVNSAMMSVAQQVEDITIVDLYAEYPRFNINIDREQERLLEHDVIIFQHPLFWYSTPAIIKEWLDLVLEHGFAYGSGGDKLSGKVLMQAITAAGPDHAYTDAGYQHFPLRTFLTPMEQSARLCKMRYSPPYVLYGALAAPGKGELAPHVDGYRQMLTALRDGTYDFDAADEYDVATAATLTVKEAV